MAFRLRLIHSQKETYIENIDSKALYRDSDGSDGSDGKLQLVVEQE